MPRDCLEALIKHRLTLASSVVSLAITVYPIVDVVRRATYAARVAAVVVIANLAGVWIYREGVGEHHPRDRA